MAAKKKPIDYAAYARKYEVTEMTIRRWHAAHIDLDDLEAVATFLLKQHAPSPRALRAVHDELVKSKT